jgi:hypothetical protein
MSSSTTPGVAIYDDLNNLEVIEQHLAVNFWVCSK